MAFISQSRSGHWANDNGHLERDTAMNHMHDELDASMSKGNLPLMVYGLKTLEDNKGNEATISEEASQNMYLTD